MSEIFAQHTLEKLLGEHDFTVELLSGGVSCDTAKVSWPSGDGAVVKRALAQLRVPGQWEADVDRILAEADAIELFGAITPENVPHLISRSDKDLAIAIELASADMQDWRYSMLSGIVEPEVGTTLGRVLATWHTKTRARTLPARIAAGKNMLGIEDHVAWVTPGTFTIANVACSEDGKICGDEIQDHGSPIVRKFVSHTYVDPSVEFIARKEAMSLQSSLRIKK